MSLFDILLLMALMYGFGQLFRRHAEQKWQQEIDNLQSDIEKIQKIYKKVTIEQHGDMLYVWEHGTDKFLFQGRTSQDFQDRVPHDMVLGIMGGDPEVIKKFKELFPINETK